jgi:hypothetical protein
MTDSCCCPPEAGNSTCDLTHPVQELPVQTTCPACGQAGKPIPLETVKAQLAVILRSTRKVEYLFCKTQSCRVIYFSADGIQTYEVNHIREQVYQKEPENAEVFVCYCFEHRVGEIAAATPERRAAILDDIKTGIQSGQCACDLRNPQGSCCLGNVRSLLKRLEEESS